MENKVSSYVLGFLFDTDENRVVLIRKTKPSWQAGKLNGVGGKIEGDEHPKQAMQREFREETGVDIPERSTFHFATLQDNQPVRYSNKWIVYCFSCMSTDSVEAVKTTTEEEVVVVNVADCFRYEKLNLMRNLPVLISLALDESEIIKPVELFDRVTLH